MTSNISFITVAEKKMIFDSAVLDSSLSFQIKKEKKISECVLITGATGFLGGHLLYELLQTTTVKIICLARPNRKDKPLERVLKNLEGYKLSVSNFQDRVEVIEAQITEKNLGLELSLYERLTKEVDVIYNNAASVDFTATVSEIIGINVLTSAELLLFASKCKLLSFNHISSIGAYLSSAELLYSKELHERPDLLCMGYQRTKWASEKMMRQAKGKGLPLKIFRPAAIVGSEKIGICPKGELFPSRWLKAAIQMGYYSARKFLYPYIPVDICAKGIVALGQSDSTLLTAELIPSNPWSTADFYNCLLKLGYSLKEVSHDTWLDMLSEATFRNPIFERFAILKARGHEAIVGDVLGLFDPSVIRSISTEETQKELSKYSISLKINHENWLREMCSHFESIKFFPKRLS